MNEQEQAIDKIQQNMNYFIHEALWTLEDTLERKTEVLSAQEEVKVERSEYFRAIDELAAIYDKYPAVRSIKDYMHLQNFIWESTFLESITMEEKRKWFHSHSLASYGDFCKDNTIFDQSFPYFSVVYKVVVYERYVNYLKQRWEARVLKALEITREVLAESNRTKMQTSGKTEGKIQPVDKEPTYTFEHTLNDNQIKSLVGCVNEVKMFKGEEVTFEQLKAIFDCNFIIPLESNNNRLIAHFFDRLSYRNYITENWQVVIAKNKFFFSSKNNTFLNQNDIATAVHDVRKYCSEGKYAIINRYINGLKALPE